MRILTVRGASLEPHLEQVARLRIRVFRDFPYLYDGSLDYELDYLLHLLDCPDSVVVLALGQDDALVGASTALPMLAADADFARPFLQGPWPLEQIFYLGESVLLPEHRGQGLGHVFFDERERVARAHGARVATFCAVDRPLDHPRRPADYSSLDAFWRRRGYARRPDLQTTFMWRDLDESEESAKPMTFWTRELSGD